MGRTANKIYRRDIEWIQSLADGKLPKDLTTEKSVIAVRTRLRRVRKVFHADTVPNLVAICLRRGLID